MFHHYCVRCGSFGATVFYPSVGHVCRICTKEEKHVSAREKVRSWGLDEEFKQFLEDATVKGG